MERTYEYIEFVRVEEFDRKIYVPWTVIKEIMAAIRDQSFANRGMEQ